MCVCVITLSLCGAGDQTQCLGHARQACYQLSYSNSPKLDLKEWGYRNILFPGLAEAPQLVPATLISGCPTSLKTFLMPITPPADRRAIPAASWQVESIRVGTSWRVISVLGVGMLFPAKWLYWGWEAGLPQAHLQLIH